MVNMVAVPLSSNFMIRVLRGSAMRRSCVVGWVVKILGSLVLKGWLCRCECGVATSNHFFAIDIWMKLSCFSMSLLISNLPWYIHTHNTPTLKWPTKLNVTINYDSKKVPLLCIMKRRFTDLRYHFWATYLTFTNLITWKP